MAKADDDWWCAVRRSEEQAVTKAERVKDVLLELREKHGGMSGIVLEKVKDARKRGVSGL